MAHRLAFLLALALFPGLVWAGASAPGLQVDASGTLLHEGRPIRAFGMNYMSAFTRCLANPDDTSYRDGFRTLAAYDIPFVRLNFGGFYPVDWKLYREDPNAYFKLMDGVVRAAEEHSIGLVPSLFWWTACIPDIVGEPRNQWGNCESKTHAFMREYVRRVVNRYVDSPAIWAWEFGNEYSLAVDLPNAAEHRPWTHVSRGCPAERGPDDDLSSAMVNTAIAAFAREVRAIDPHRPITTGHSLPRPSAFHQRSEGTWTQDSIPEFHQSLIFATPAPANMISIHVYPHAKENRFGAESVSYSTIIEEASRAARDAGMPLFVGEFGPPPDNEAPWSKASAKTEGIALIEALEASSVQLAAFWVFDFPWQESSINVSASNHRADYLDVLQAANLRMQSAAN